MRIAYLYPFWRDFPLSHVDNAMDVVGSELPTRVAARGHEAILYSGVEKPRSTAERVHGSTVEVAGVRYHRLATANDLWGRLAVATRLRAPIGGASLRAEWYAPGSSLRKQLAYGLPAALSSRRRRVDVVHVCIFDELVPLVRALCPDSKIVLHMHDHKQAYRDAELTRGRLARADAIVGCSEFITNAVKTRFPELADRCATIWNAVEDDPLPDADPSPRPKRLLFTGRLSPEKGVHTVLDAFEAVLARHPETELTLVGPDTVAPLQDADPSGADPRLAELRGWYGDSRRYPQHLRERLSPEARSRAHFVGPVDHAETSRYLRAADVVLFPSLWDEPFGLPVTEGMAAGRPVIATRVGAFPELVEDGASGFLVEPGDVDSLAAAILRLFDDDDLLQAIGAAARDRVQKLFSWERCMDSWDSLYGGLVGART